MSMAQEEAIVNLEKLIALFHTASTHWMPLPAPPESRPPERKETK